MKEYIINLNAGTYTISIQNVSGTSSDNFRLVVHDNHWTYQRTLYFNANSYATFTISPDNTSSIFLQVYAPAIGNTINCSGYIMLNEGSIALPYQPYEGEVIHESGLKTINGNSIVGGGNIGITESLFTLVGKDVDTITITTNETYFITSSYSDKIYVSELPDASFYGSVLISTMDMDVDPYIAINGVQYGLSLECEKLTLLTSGMMNVYKKKI